MHMTAFLVFMNMSAFVCLMDWWFRSTALYVFMYAVYYFFMKTNMSGFLQVRLIVGLYCLCLVCSFPTKTVMSGYG